MSAGKASFFLADPYAELTNPKPRKTSVQFPASLSADAFHRFVRGSRQQRSDPAYDTSLFAPFEIVAREKGQRIFSRWFEGVSPFRVIEAALSEAPSADCLQLSVTTSLTAIDHANWQEVLANKNSGRFGLQLSLDDSVHRVSPLETIATNRPLKMWFRSFLDERSLSDEKFFALGGRMSTLGCRQFLIGCSSRLPVVETFRGNEVVAAHTPADQLCEEVIARMARWFMANVGADGSLPYKYWPSNGKESPSDNPIRRFMATVAFNRLGFALGRSDIKTAARRNLEFNIKRFFKIRDGLGAIEWDGSIKLGAVALAALAILESPFSERWSGELDLLRRTIDHLWLPTGAFRTFLIPEDRNDNQNFYPGEALLFWATSLQRKRDDALMERTLRSVDYYRNHFRRNPNPAFVPWHTQAAAMLLALTGEPALRSYIYEMNDWLLPHQQWGGTLDADLYGRFYSPAKPHYGPPHASSTGVYMEGLVDAMAVARTAGDHIRADAYERAVNRGIRSIAQLQFKDSVDAFYVSQRDKVMGAVRTETYNNEIRVDNLQHALMALLKFRGLDRGISSGGEAADRQVAAGEAR